MKLAAAAAAAAASSAAAAVAAATNDTDADSAAAANHAAPVDVMMIEIVITDARYALFVCVRNEKRGKIM